MFKFSKGNSKLSKDTLIFDLPAGKSCPGAKDCLAFIIHESGKRHLVDGPESCFRCFAASNEVRFPAVSANRESNFLLAKKCLRTGMLVYQLDRAIHEQKTKKTKKIRIHSSGDFFSLSYLLGWLEVARINPDLDFYCYSKSLHFFVKLGPGEIPPNFYVTASMGGRFDHLIESGFFPRYAVVVNSEAEAETKGFLLLGRPLEIDHDDSHCFGPSPFALLVHGSQPKGSEAGKAINARKKAGLFVGYSS